jgi:hypothetical protein
MLAWVRQHIEWTLASGASDMPDGVLMMVLDTVGRAAMSVGSYAALTACDTTQLMERALQACSEGAQTGVAPETLWAWHADTLIAGYAEDGVLSGSASLVRDLATTRKIEVVLEPNLSNWWMRQMRFFLCQTNTALFLLPIAQAGNRRILLMTSRDYLTMCAHRRDGFISSMRHEMKY